MSSLQPSRHLGRPIRQDEPTQLGVATRRLFSETLRRGDGKGARQYLDYLFEEHFIIRELNAQFASHIVRHVLDRRKTENWGSLVEESIAPWVGTTAGRRGEPCAAVTQSGPATRLSVPGADWEFHVTQGEGRYDVTLGPLQSQRSRWRKAAAGNRRGRRRRRCGDRRAADG